MTTAVSYMPLDEILERPAVRLLRILRWWDDATAGDLFQAIDLPGHLEDSYLHVLRRMSRNGYVTRSGLGLSHSPFHYRISAVGRRYLAAEIDRARIKIFDLSEQDYA